MRSFPKIKINAYEIIFINNKTFAILDEISSNFLGGQKRSIIPWRNLSPNILR